VTDNFPVRWSFRERVIEPEILDGLPPGAGRDSLADLVRINRHWGGHSSTRDLVRRTTRHDETFSLLDVGAATGDIAAVIRAMRPGARVTLLDHIPHHLVDGVGSAKLVADAFRLPFSPGSFDFVFSSLFLHHFANDQVTELLAGFARVARRGVLAVDLERRLIPYYFLPATRRLYGWNSVTLHDGPVSVAAGFRKRELKALARAAGLREPVVRTHGLAYRLTLHGSVR
jgi:SAM-dependent methyltransferase